MLSKLVHPNVVGVVGVCVYPPSICLVMELCANGNLYELLRRNYGLSVRSMSRKLQVGGCMGVCVVCVSMCACA
jgi:serine/threonine protein kinase